MVGEYGRSLPSGLRIIYLTKKYIMNTMFIQKRRNLLLLLSICFCMPAFAGNDNPSYDGPCVVKPDSSDDRYRPVATTATAQ